ncbi:MAG: EAL domain-containing protein [Thermoleophilia bacterium]
MDRHERHGGRRAQGDAGDALIRAALDQTDDPVIGVGADLRLVYLNGAADLACGGPPGAALGRDVAECGLFGDAGPEVRALLEAAVPADGPDRAEVAVCDGTRIFSLRVAADRDGDGHARSLLLLCTDITRERRLAEDLREREHRFRTLAENAGDNIIRWDTDVRVRYMNPAMAAVFGAPEDEVIGRHPHEVFPDLRYTAVVDTVEAAIGTGEPQLLDLRFPGQDGRMEYHQIRIVPERDEAGRVVSVIGVGRDITEKMRHMEIVESLLHTDPLTRLFNRQALHERAPTLLAAAARRGQQVAVMLLDLDHFKAVNDGMGHSAGDVLLRQVADRVAGRLRPDDLLVRLGGDEFVVVAPHVGDPREVAAIVGRLQRAIAEPMTIDGREMRVSASIGVAVFPGDGAGLEELLAHADSAMYHAKHNGRGRSEYYRSELSDAVHRRLELQEAMREASTGTGLELFFQPQVRLDDPGRVVGAEALLRWHHPTLGLIAPDQFIGLAEETGMIAPMGRWVLETTAVRWNRDRREPLTIAVNVSTRQFTLDELIGTVDEVLRTTGCDPRWLGFEITESALIEDSAVVQRTLEDLRARGISVAVDDFGTGYSALNYLVRFPLDHMKIDKSFVQGIGRGERDDELVKAFIAMASALHLGTVAEGIETPGQAAFLLAHGCRVAQGYLYGRPVPVGEFERLHLPPAGALRPAA